tara:strand:+ start:403 stop:1044 length:642 start_codon:yes stop_codon:yes gene_type:complete
MEKRSTEVSGKFTTPIWTGIIQNHEEVNKKLTNYINEIKTKNPEGLKKSNNLGWHSPEFDLNDKMIKEFFLNISPMIKEVADDMAWDLKNNKIKISNCWSIINYKYASNAAHTHGNSLISSAYYVQATKNCGNIVFDDPRPGAVMTRPKFTSLNKWNEGNIGIEPKNGLLVMFPSFLSHYVQPNMSDKERIMVSFNLNLLHNRYWGSDKKELG